MRIRLASLLLCAVVFGAVGCQAPVVPGGEWTERGTVEFVGEGSSVMVKEDDPLALLEARAAARALALADLLATVKGTEVAAQVTVEDLMYESLEATVTVEGTLSGVSIEYEELREEDGGATVVTAIASLELTPAQLRRTGWQGE